MAGPLNGLRVYEIGWGAPASIMGMLLSDYGAQVIKIERPGEGAHRSDPTRSTWDRGKWSIELDLEMEVGSSTMQLLLQHADVVIEAMGPGRAAERGLDFAQLHGVNPSLVYASVTGYGHDGPLKDRPGFANLIEARFGMMSEQEGFSDAPHFLGHPVVEYCSSFLGVISILAALRTRFLDGKGQYIDATLLDGALAANLMNWWWHEQGFSYLAREGEETGFGRNRLITDLFVCGDGEYLMNHTGGDGGFKRTMDILGLGEHVQTIDGLEMAVPLNDEEYHAARELVPEAFKTKSRAEWIALLHEADLAALPVLRPHEIFEEPQLVYSKLIKDVVADDGSTLRQIGPTLLFDKTPAPDPKGAPSVGANNAELTHLLEGRLELAPTASASTPTHPLEGVRVLDLSGFFATAFGAKLLADLGADVIKIEPVFGDQMRPLKDLYEGGNRGKRNLALNTRSEDGMKVLLELIKTADVLMHNQRPGKAEKAGFGYEQVKAINPNIVYCYLPGFGSSGPMMNLKSFAPLVSGFTGHLYSGAGEDNPPVRRVIGNEDLYNGFSGAIAALLGLYHREKTGEGQYLEAPHLNSSLLVRTELATDLDGNPANALMLNHDQTGYSPTYRNYQCSDGWVSIAVFGDEKFASLITALHLEPDARFSDQRGRDGDPEGLTSYLAGGFAAMSAQQAFEALDGAGVPVEVVLDYPLMSEFLWDEWGHETERIYEGYHLEHGWIRTVGQLCRLSATPGKRQDPSAPLGHHSAEILAELGYDDAAVAALIEAKVIKAPSAS